MKRAHFPLIATRIFLCGGLFVVAAQHAAPLLGNQSPNSKPAVQSKSQKVANPLNDLLDEAQRDIDSKNFEAAIVPLQKVIAEQPEFAYAHFQLAYVYTALKKTDEARAEYGRTIAIDPKMSEAYLNLGMMLLDKQEEAAAIAPLRKAVELLPAQSRPRYLLAVAQDRTGDRAGATESFEALLHLDPNDITAIDYLGWGALRKGNPEEAEARFRHALEVQPNGAESRRGLAQSLDAQKREYGKALSSAFFLGGNYRATLAALDDIAKMEQPGAGAWFVRAICYDKLNQPKLALQAYQKFLELDQDKNPAQVWQAKERSKVLQRMLERKR